MSISLTGDSCSQQWLQEVYSILERLRLQCGDYAKLAMTQDNDYQTYSPYLHHSTATSRRIEFPLEIQSDDTPSTGMLTFRPSGRKKSIIEWFIVSRSTTNWESWKWALFEKRKFERFLQEFKKWTSKIKELVPLMLALHPRYDSTAVLESLITNEHSNRLGMAPHARLRKLTIEPAVHQTNFFLQNATLDALLDRECLTMASLLKNSSSSEKTPDNVLVEFKKYGEDNVDARPDTVTVDRVQQLASLLSSAGKDNLRTLSFRGIIDLPQQSRYAFIFNFPSQAADVEPISLHALIDSAAGSASRLTLPQRFRVAQDVTRAISAFHVDGWVHKSIRSQSIIFFQDRAAQSSRLYADPFLVDFEFARPQTAETQYTFDNNLERNLYRHPDRQGPPTVSFQKMHDIYSLGVVLLEIGLWQTAMSIHQGATKRLKEGVIMNPHAMQNLYIEIARRRLPHHMGPAYRDAVIKCLSCKSTDDDSRLAIMFYEEVVQNIDVTKLQ